MYIFLDPSFELDVFRFDKDDCQSSKLSAALGVFFRAMFYEHLRMITRNYLNQLPATLMLRVEDNTFFMQDN